ncbi:type II 3-dehydroquinate dehydratase [Methylophilaceae bacterium]|mgnify:FL=1|jgi:3-dehydroquinate dehydratase-2|nr:type II 3-dehydroquinate dehydratase [Nitrosomonadales bacterium]MCH9771215.1 type II 3-dehydroquinate dehydratase [Betaproteobacteria bacterium]MDA9086736.1 type II 3-dehydroquinate dehydratase [Methylophilaceae bacterium]MBT6232418.1 type II 3-dehydroquinate dehydratase [Nitrosomonadales bacterium]MBT6356392.1 type II 3-dehydroquinate dehydratase [Nitrosomonadales bacterium]
MSKKRISVIHGPNLNLLGSREPEHYGKMTLDDINASLKNRAKELNIDIEFFQSNSESEIVNKIQSLSTDFTIINPAAFTHSSVAIRDSLVAKNVKFIEVHLSNVFAREDFRKNSFFSDVAIGIISGLGAEGYIAALNFINQTK